MKKYIFILFVLFSSCNLLQKPTINISDEIEILRIQLETNQFELVQVVFRNAYLQGIINYQTYGELNEVQFKLDSIKMRYQTKSSFMLP